MLRPCEYADKSPEHELEAALSVLWRKIWDRWLFSYDEPQFRNEIQNELSVRTQRIKQRVPPSAEFHFLLAEKGKNQALEGPAKVA